VSGAPVEHPLAGPRDGQARAATGAASLGVLALLAVYVAIAVAFRAPAHLYVDLNLDESLYRLIGDSLAAGHAPYTTLWDRKPVGTFLITAAIRLGFGESLLAFRLTASFFVAVTALLLHLNGRIIFPAQPWVGAIAGFLFIVHSTQNGGAGTNTELLYTPAGLAGLLCLLRAARSSGAAVPGLGFLAGLAFGIALHIKQYAIFDVLAYAAMGLLLAPDPWARETLRRQAGIAVATAIGMLVPALAFLLWYLGIGRLDLYLEANVRANLGLLGAAVPAFNLPGLKVGLSGFAPLFIGTAVTLGLMPLLPEARAARRGVLALLCWLAAMALSLLASRRFADHFFLQVLPAIAMTTALGLVLLARAVAASGLASPRGARLGLLGVVGLIGLGSAARPFHAAAETLWRRHVDGIAHWGDRTATVAAAIGERVDGAGSVYVFGRLLGLYGLTATAPPTRFPFGEHLFAGYAPVDGAAEMARILATRPRFVVVDNHWLAPPTGRPAAAALVFEALQAELAAHYVVDGRVGLFRSWRGGNVGGAVDATVFRRNDVAGPSRLPAIQYRPGA
jgi:hypothetical protein